MTTENEDTDINMFTPPEVLAAQKAAEETPAEVEEQAEVEEEVVEPEEAAEPEEEQPEKKPKRTTADRIKRLAQERNASRQEVEALKAQIATLAASGIPLVKPDLTAEKQPANAGSVQAPDAAKYTYGELDPQFIRDTARHEALEALKAELENERKSQQDSRQAEAEARELARLREQATTVETAGAKAYDDFHEVVIGGAQSGDYPLTKEMFEAALATPVAEHLLYHLAGNPDEAAKVAEMGPREQGMWFGRMEAKFTKPAVAARKFTNAPEPIGSAKGSGGAPKTKADTMDFAAFEKMAQAAKG